MSEPGSAHFLFHSPAPGPALCLAQEGIRSQKRLCPRGQLVERERPQECQ